MNESDNTEYDGLVIGDFVKAAGWGIRPAGLINGLDVAGVARPLTSADEISWMTRNFGSRDRTGYYLPIKVAADPGTILQWKTFGEYHKTETVPSSGRLIIIIPLSRGDDRRTIFNVYHPADTDLMGIATFEVNYKNVILPADISDNGKHYQLIGTPPLTKPLLVGEGRSFSVVDLDAGGRVVPKQDVVLIGPPNGCFSIRSDNVYVIGGVEVGVGYLIMHDKDFKLTRNKFHFVPINVV